MYSRHISKFTSLSRIDDWFLDLVFTQGTSTPRENPGSILTPAKLFIYLDEVGDKRIKEEFENGKEYYQFRGKSLLYLPEDIKNRPKNEFIQWHNENLYKG